MESRRLLRWASEFVLWATVTTVASLAVVWIGLDLGAMAVVETYQRTGDISSTVVVDAVPGPAVVAAGVLLWGLGVSAGLFRTFVGALTEALADTYDTQQVKSEILAVLDDRLSTLERQLESSRTTGTGDDGELGIDD
ncbi:MAG: hypothetical protein ABEJ35_00295 [Halobacteriaceae archaeon]